MKLSQVIALWMRTGGKHLEFRWALGYEMALARGYAMARHRLAPVSVIIWASTWEIVFAVNANSKDPDQPAGIYSLIRYFAILRYVQQYPMVLQTDSEGPDQTARMRSLIWSFAVRICPDTFMHDEAYLIKLKWLWFWRLQRTMPSRTISLLYMYMQNATRMLKN